MASLSLYCYGFFFAYSIVISSSLITMKKEIVTRSTLPIAKENLLKLQGEPDIEMVQSRMALINFSIDLMTDSNTAH